MTFRLGKSYWIYGVLVGTILRFVSPLLTYILASNAKIMSEFDIILISYSFYALMVIYSFIVLVGIWRSSNKYAALNPKQHYSALAKAAVILGAFSLVAVFGNLASNEKNSISSLSEATSPDEKMQYQAIISGLNTGLPKMIDQITRLDKIDLQSSGYIYYDTIIKELDDNQKEHLLNSVKPIIASGLCKSADTLNSLNNGLSYTYIYSDSKAQPLGKITITKSDCAPE